VQGAEMHVQRSGQPEQHVQEWQELEVSGRTWGEEAGQHVQKPEKHVAGWQRPEQPEKYV